MDLQPSRRTQHAIKVLLALAESDGAATRAEDLARVTATSPGKVRDVLQALNRDGIVGSRPGLTGGYWLSRPAGAIRLIDVIDAIEGPASIRTCLITDTPCPYPVDDTCRVHNVWAQAEDAVRQILASATLADIV